MGQQSCRAPLNKLSFPTINTYVIRKCANLVPPKPASIEALKKEWPTWKIDEKMWRVRGEPRLLVSEEYLFRYRGESKRILFGKAHTTDPDLLHKGVFQSNPHEGTVQEIDTIVMR